MWSLYIALTIIAIIILILTIILLFKCLSYKKNGIYGGEEFNLDTLFELIKQKEIPPTIRYEDIDNDLEYQDEASVPKLTIHLGQKKLFLSELQFLTKYDKGYVIYAGAAPSNKINYLSTLFPDIKFIMIDPNPFNIFIKDKKNTHYNTEDNNVVYLKYRQAKNQYFKNNQSEIKIIDFEDDKIKNIKTEYGPFPNNDLKNKQKEQMLKYISSDKTHRIFLIGDWFGDDYAKIFSELSKTGENLYFWSDIRTVDKGRKYPSAKEKLENLKNQHNWTKLIKPKAAMLKFVNIYYTPESSYTDTFFQKYIDSGFKDFNYFDGEILLQAFPGRNSPETRLIVTDYNSNKIYNMKEYDSKMSYYNNIDRNFNIHTNNYSNPQIGFDKCNDCALEANIWEEYCKKFKLDPKTTIPKKIKEINKILDINLFKDNHGKLFYPMSKPHLINLKKIIKINTQKRLIIVF